MRFHSKITNGALLRKIRTSIGMTVDDATTLTGVSARQIGAWEAGSQPMPQARLEAFTQKLEQRNLQGELVVVKAFDGQQWLVDDVVSELNFVSLALLPDGRGRLRSLATDKATGGPFVHETIFDVENNEHVVRIAMRWQRDQMLRVTVPVFDEDEEATARAVVTSMNLLARAAEARNPRIRVLKDSILVASRAADAATNAQDREAELARVSTFSRELMKLAMNNLS